MPPCPPAHTPHPARSSDPSTFKYYRKELSPRGAVHYKPVLDDQRLNYLYHVRQSQIITGGWPGGWARSLS
jgi:hypothetical protein